MRPAISLLGQRASATILCSNLILEEDRLIILLTAYGPSQEVRAFAQILRDREPPLLEIPGKKGVRVSLGGVLSLIARMENGYSGLYLLPNRERRLIVGNSREECFAIYSRILDQQQFVHRDWYPPLFDLAEKLEPVIGSKLCYRHMGNVAEEVSNRIKNGDFAFPVSTAQITVSVKPKQQQQ
jgi:hypothetical protein